MLFSFYCTRELYMKQALCNIIESTRFFVRFVSVLKVILDCEDRNRSLNTSLTTKLKHWIKPNAIYFWHFLFENWIKYSKFYFQTSTNSNIVYYKYNHSRANDTWTCLHCSGYYYTDSMWHVLLSGLWITSESKWFWSCLGSGIKTTLVTKQVTLDLQTRIVVSNNV